MTKSNSRAEQSIQTCWMDKLAEFKAREKPEVVLLLGDDPDLVRITVAWTNMPTCLAKKLTQPPRTDNPNIGWGWLWENTVYSRQELMDKAHHSHQGFDRKLKALIGNRLLYPDGTIHSLAQRYLRDRVLKLFTVKTSRSRGKTKEIS